MHSAYHQPVTVAVLE